MPSWIFLNPTDRESVRRKQMLMARIDAWWQEFQSKTHDLNALFHGRREWDLPAWMSQHLQGIHEGLMWEFGPDRARGMDRLVITPETRKQLRPMVETILTRAPKLPGWAFLPYRPAEPEDMARQMVEARIGVPLPDAVTVRASAGELNRIDVVFESPGFSRRDKDQALHQTFVTLESLLGEEILDKWIGLIDVERSRPGKHSLPLGRLKATVDAVINSIRDQLPGRPLSAQPLPEKGAVVELKPDERDDYAKRDDLLVASTMFPNILTATLRDTSFYSERFSRCGERFGYLKIDGRDPGAMAFEDRAAIEDAVDQALGAAKVGRVIGGGTGLRYSYVELALTDVVHASKVLREVLQHGRLPRCAWLLFHDCDWRDEWIGIWDDTPVPPAIEEEE